MISQMFAISIDELINNEYEIGQPSFMADKSDIVYSEYNGFYWNIELNGWNDGVFDVVIVGEEKDILNLSIKMKSVMCYVNVQNL